MPDFKYDIDPLFVGVVTKSVEQAMSYIDDLGRRLENVAARAQANAYRCAGIWECLDGAKDLLADAASELADLEESLS
jgi:hypothetical protein